MSRPIQHTGPANHAPTPPADQERNYRVAVASALFFSFFLGWLRTIRLAGNTVRRSTPLEAWSWLMVGTPIMLGLSSMAVDLVWLNDDVAVRYLSVHWVAFSLLLGIPTLSLIARRLHDVGLSGRWTLIILIPWWGASFLALVTLFAPSEDGANAFGDATGPHDLYHE